MMATELHAAMSNANRWKVRAETAEQQLQAWRDATARNDPDDCKMGIAKLHGKRKAVEARLRAVLVGLECEKIAMLMVQSPETLLKVAQVVTLAAKKYEKAERRIAELTTVYEIEHAANLLLIEDKEQSDQRARELEHALFIQTESAKCLGRVVNDKDADRIFFRDRVAELQSRIDAALEVPVPVLERYANSTLTDDVGYTAALAAYLATVRAKLRGE
jgi:hypothetical protein